MKESFESAISQIYAKVVPLEMICLYYVPHAMLLDLQKFWNGLSHLAVLTFPVRAATKQSALPC